MIRAARLVWWVWLGLNALVGGALLVMLVLAWTGVLFWGGVQLGLLITWLALNVGYGVWQGVILIMNAWRRRQRGKQKDQSQ